MDDAPVKVLTVTLAVAAILLLAAPARPTGASVAPALSGSLIQPPLVDRLSDSELAAEEGDLTRAGLTQQVLQWTADSGSGTAVYPSGLSGYAQSTRTDVVSRLLGAADTAGLKVYLGLQISDAWWTNHGDDATWLSGQATVSTELAADLSSKYGRHSSFAGWYLPFEVDNSNFTTAASWSNLASYYTTVAGYLDRLTPGLPVIIAPSFDTAGGLSSSQWTTMWEAILGHCPVNVVALQDGSGDGHTSTSQLGAWFAATRSAITAASPSTQLWADTETYNATFEPQSIATVVADMRAAQPYVSDFLSFSYDHYDSPLQVGPLYDETYRDYRTAGTVESTPPAAPTGLAATAVDSFSIGLSWTAATDNVGVAGYQVYRGGALVQTIYGAATGYTDAGLTPSTSYTYQVAAFDAAGNVSADSASATATTAAAPANPVDLAPA